MASYHFSVGTLLTLILIRKKSKLSELFVEASQLLSALTQTCSVVEGPVMAHGSLGEELSTTGTEELELLSEESGGAGLWQNFGPMIILG